MNIQTIKSMLENRQSTLERLSTTNYATGNIDEYNRNIAEIEEIKQSIEIIDKGIEAMSA